MHKPVSKILVCTCFLFSGIPVLRMPENDHSKSIALVMFCTSRQPFPYWV